MEEVGGNPDDGDTLCRPRTGNNSGRLASLSPTKLVSGKVVVPQTACFAPLTGFSGPFPRSEKGTELRGEQGAKQSSEVEEAKREWSLT